MATAGISSAGAPRAHDAASLAAVDAAWQIYLENLHSEASDARTGAALATLAAHGQSALVEAHYLAGVQSHLREAHMQPFWAAVVDDDDVAEFVARLEVRVRKWAAEARGGGGGGGGGGGTRLAQTLHAAVERSAVRVAWLAHRLGDGAYAAACCGRFRARLAALVVSSAPPELTARLRQYYSKRLAEFSAAARGGGGGGGGSDAEEDDSDADDDDASSMEFAEGADGSPAALLRLGDAWAEEVASVARQLRRLGLGALSEEAYTNVLRSCLEAHIRKEGENTFDVPLLAPTLGWLDAVPLAFLRLVLPGDADNGTDGTDADAGVGDTAAAVDAAAGAGAGAGVASLREGLAVQWRSRLRWLVYETLGALRTVELFDIICNYPESTPAVQDLHQCLQNTNHHAQVISTFRTAVQKRLLQPGAATTSILYQFVSTIRVLRELDPAGVLLAAVRVPLQQYLRARKDTIRCIVTMLTDEGTGMGGDGSAPGMSLLEELGRASVEGEGEDSDGPDGGDAGGLALNGSEAAVAADAPGGGEEWMPEAVDAEPQRAARSRSVTDILSMLVAIYGSKELLVNEYRALLALRLLAKSDYQTDRETHTVELLKLQFGEANMHNCAVMLLDIHGSKRINHAVKTPGMGQAPAASSENDENAIAAKKPTARDVQEAALLETLDTTIISELFWPPFGGDTQEEFNLPPQIKEMLDVYGKRYTQLKAPRKLNWHPQLGTVKLALEFDDGRVREFSVTPLHASIVMKFEERKEWPMAELADSLGVSPAVLRRKVVLWVNHGVLAEARGAGGEGDIVYQLLEEDGGKGEGASTHHLSMGDDDEGTVASAEEQQRREQANYESLVLGMLTNFDAMPLERMHNMLKMLVQDPPFDKTLAQLEAFLGAMVSAEKLTLEGGLYRKAKPTVRDIE